MRVKSSVVAPGLANARPPDSAKFANAPIPGTDKAGKCPAVARGTEIDSCIKTSLSESILKHVGITYDNLCCLMNISDWLISQ